MILVLLPAFNEEKALPKLVKKFHEVLIRQSNPYRIYVYDDGSSDSTREIARQLSGSYPIEVLFHEKNAGLGQTLKDGLQFIAKESRDDDWVVTMDCDDTHDPTFLPAAFEKIQAGYDCVLLSRFSEGGGQRGLSSIKSFLSQGSGLFLKFFFPIKGVREYSCIYRVCRASILKRGHAVFGDRFVELTDWGFVASPEILIKFRMLGARITESPFVLKYDLKESPSKNDSRKTIQGYFMLVWSFWGRRAKKVHASHEAC